MPTTEGAYRCGECRSWRHLRAWAAAVIEGPLNADGDLAEYACTEECFLHEDSIECTRHLGAHIECFTKGRWCRWWWCRKCDGTGCVGVDRSRLHDRGYPCPEGIRTTDGRNFWQIHQGWIPLSEFAAREAALAGKEAQ